VGRRIAVGLNNIVYLCKIRFAQGDFRFLERIRCSPRKVYARVIVNAW